MSNQYAHQISEDLESALTSSPKREMQLKGLKLIIFSDLHKGQKDKADDFQSCKPAYHAALAYYYQLGFTLVLAGDVEELWECMPRTVVKKYSDTLALEERFAKEKRYLRIWGNHDDHWNKPKAVRKLLGEHVYRSEVVHGVRFIIMNDERQLGELFLTHGHQGTKFSDKLAWISKPFVRHVWRNVQRVTGLKSTTPAKDFQLRKTHELAMHQWANTKEKLVLIAGHTHHPVFMSKSHEDVILEDISVIQKALESCTDIEQQKALQLEISELHAKLQWVLAKSDDVEIRFDQDAKPCYFNAGCCSFSDGDITGLEIEGDDMRLVRWPDDDGAPRKKILTEGKLTTVFGML